MSVALGLDRIHPSAAADRAHILRYTTTRSTSDDPIFDLRAGSASGTRVLRINKDGQMQGANGTALLPTWSFESDKDSGIYRIGADNLGLTLGGTKRWDFGTAGSTLTGTLTVSGAATLQSTIAVTGAATLSSTLAAGNTTITGTLSVSGATTLSSTLAVTGAATLTAAATFSGGFTSAGVSTFQNLASVTGGTIASGAGLCFGFVDGAAGGAIQTFSNRKLTLNAIGNAVEIAAAAGSLGFFGTTAVTKETGVAVTAAGIHAALVRLGLFAA